MGMSTKGQKSEFFGVRRNFGVPVYLAPWAACSLGVKLSLGSLPLGVKIPGYLAPILDNLPPLPPTLRRWSCIWAASPGAEDTLTLRKYAYSNILKILQPKKENFQIKDSDILHNPAQNIDCGYSLEPPQTFLLNSHLNIHNTDHNLFFSKHEGVYGDRGWGGGGVRG